MEKESKKFFARVARFYEGERKAQQQKEQDVKAREASLAAHGEISPEDQARLDFERAFNAGRKEVLVGVAAILLTEGIQPEDITEL